MKKYEILIAGVIITSGYMYGTCNHKPKYQLVVKPTVVQNQTTKESGIVVMPNTLASEKNNEKQAEIAQSVSETVTVVATIPHNIIITQHSATSPSASDAANSSLAGQEQSVHNQPPLSQQPQGITSPIPAEPVKPTILPEQASTTFSHLTAPFSAVPQAHAGEKESVQSFTHKTSKLFLTGTVLAGVLWTLLIRQESLLHGSITRIDSIIPALN